MREESKKKARTIFARVFVLFFFLFGNDSFFPVSLRAALCSCAHIYTIQEAL